MKNGVKIGVTERQGGVWNPAKRDSDEGAGILSKSGGFRRSWIRKTHGSPYKALATLLVSKIFVSCY